MKVKLLETGELGRPRFGDPRRDLDLAADGELEESGADIGPLAGDHHPLGDGAGGRRADDAALVVALSEITGRLGGGHPGGGEIVARLRLVEGGLRNGLVRPQISSCVRGPFRPVRDRRWRPRGWPRPAAR